MINSNTNPVEWAVLVVCEGTYRPVLSTVWAREATEATEAAMTALAAQGWVPVVSVSTMTAV